MPVKKQFKILLALTIQAVLVTVYLGIRQEAIKTKVFSVLYTETPGTSLRNSRFHNSEADQNSWTIDELPPSKSEVFQPIDDEYAWVYSAFYDHMAAQNGRPLVRVFGIAFKNVPSQIHCSFITGGRIVMSAGNITGMPDTHDMKDIPSYLECSLPIHERPTQVSVSFKADTKPTNRLQILYPGPRIRNFTVCYSILHSDFNMATQLIENIEMNRILGAEHFVVYNYSISRAVNHILNRYQDDGLFTVLQWSLPTGQSWYFAQMAALNDCFYRNRNTSRFVVVVDTDELIVPANHLTWKDLIQNVSAEEPDISQFTNSSEPPSMRHNLTSCLSVRTSYFYRDVITKWNTLPPQFSFLDEEKSNIVKYNLLSLSQFWRQEIIYNHGSRSKYIARPELSKICGMHFVWEFTTPSSCFPIHENNALVHHYRVYYPSKPIVYNINVLMFKEELYPRVMEQIKWFSYLLP